MPMLHKAVRLAARLVGIDARRPASWLTLAAAICCGAVPETAAGAALPAFVAGAVLAVAAIGDLPVAAGVTLGHGSRAVAIWLVERVAWPGVGLALVAFDHCLRRGPAGLTLPGAAAVGLAAAALTVFVARRRAANAADASSLTLISAGVAAVAGALGGSIVGARPLMSAVAGELAVALAAWLALGVVALGIERRAGIEPDWLHDASRTGHTPPRLLRTALTAAAMGTALVAMVGWLFLDPLRAGFLPPLSLGWFIALAVPEATLGDGVAHTVGWRRLARSAADATPRRHLASTGRGRDAVAATLSNAAILGWPPLVAAALAAGNSEGAWAAAITVLALAAAAVALATVARALEAVAATPETAHAVALALLLAVQAAVPARSVQPGLGGEPPRLPGLPLPASVAEPVQKTGSVTLSKRRLPARLTV